VINAVLKARLKDCTLQLTWETERRTRVQKGSWLFWAWMNSVWL